MGDDEAITGLAMRAARGDQLALDAFVRAMHGDVWRFVAYLTHANRADDLTQETFLRAVAALPRFAGRSSARTWLLSIARRVVVDQIRYESTRPSTPINVFDSNHAAHRAARHEEHIEWSILIDSLSSERHEAFLLTQILGLTYADAAAICGCPVGTIRSRVARAREDLIAANEADTERGIG